MGNRKNKKLKTSIFDKKWPELSKPLENLSLLKPPRKPSPERLPEKPPLPEVVSKNHTDSDQVPSPSEKSEDTKRPLTSSSGSSHSRDSSEKSPTLSTKSSDSNPPPSSPSKRPLKPTSSVSSRTPTFAPSTPRESPSCPRMSNSPEESEVRGSDQYEFDN